MTTQACLPRNALKEYLSGWTDDERTEQIEGHLAECVECEQTVISLESDPDTLWETLREPAQTHKSVVDCIAVDADLASVVERAKRLMDPTNQTAPKNWHPSLVDIGAYELIQPLGRGGMGAVYLARHRQLGKQVAIKLLPAPSAIDPDIRERFLREIRAAGRLNHPSVVAATDAGEHQGTHYLVMEHIIGLDLSRLARHIGPIPIADACEIARQAALGLSHAHSEGIVHRDIKPSNLMLDETGRVKILDFGLAQLDRWDENQAELTTVGQLMGTLDYMAPEQADRCGSVDYRADLYALGATLFRLLCGRAPLAATPKQSPLEKLRMLANHQPPRLDTLRDDAPKALVQLVGMLLARHPEDRPASAAHVAEQLQPFTEGNNLCGILEKARAAAQSDPLPQLNAPNVLPQLNRSENHSRGRNRWRWLIATAALIPLIIVGGILLILETQKGQLVINSDSDVQVKIIAEGKPTTDLQVKPGANSIKLYADKYEVTVSPSDGFTIENENFSLSNGGIVVATIRRGDSQKNPSALVLSANDNNVIQNQPTTFVPPSSELVFDGIPLSTWIIELERNRSPRATWDALNALAALFSPATSGQITDALLRIMPQRDGDQVIGGQIRFDDMAVRTLAKAQPYAKYCELLIDHLKTADDAYAHRIFSTGASLEKVNRGEGLHQLIDWIDKETFSKTTTKSPSFAADASVFLYGLVKAQPNQVMDKDREFAAETLKRSNSLELNFWLIEPISAMWPRAFRDEVLRRAANALTDDKLDPSLVCRATVILKADRQRSVIPDEDLKSIVLGRIRALSKDPNRLLQFVPEISHAHFANQMSIPISNKVAFGTVSPDYFPGGGYGTVGPDNLPGGGYGTVSPDNFPGASLESIELLMLARRWKKDASFMEALNDLLSVTKNQHEAVASQIAMIKPDLNSLGPPRITLPDLTIGGLSKASDIETRMERLAFLIHETTLALLAEAVKPSPNP